MKEYLYKTKHLISLRLKLTTMYNQKEPKKTIWDKLKVIFK